MLLLYVREKIILLAFFLDIRSYNEDEMLEGLFIHIQRRITDSNFLPVSNNLFYTKFSLNRLSSFLNKSYPVINQSTSNQPI